MKRGAGCAFALALLAPACVAPVRAGASSSPPDVEPIGAPVVAPAPVVEASAARATLRRAEGRVEVLLGAASGHDEVRVSDPRAGELVLVRAGAKVRARGEERAEWLLAPEEGGALRVQDRSYPGLVRVLPSKRGGLEVRALVDLEDYVTGVVAAELSVWSAPPALLEAQAIAVRSYATAELDHRGRSARRPYLFDDTRDMVYRGDPQAPAAALARLRGAIERTRGLVLREGARVLDARFHAACGGRTADGRSVFPECDFAALAPVDCRPCLDDPPAEWRTTATGAELDALGRAAGLRSSVVRLRPTRVDGGGRWLEVELSGRGGGSARVPFETVRRLLGAERVASALVLGTWPRAGEPIENGLALRGRGSGHGVGMCQRGARALAEAGWSAERILAHYYPGAKLADGRGLPLAAR